MAETVALTMGELDRLQVMSQLAERGLTRRRAAALLGLSERQVRRLYRVFRRDGAKALASRHRVSMPAQPCGPQPCRPGKADISTWGRSGHFDMTVEHEGTGSPAGPDADRRAAPDALARGGALRAVSDARSEIARRTGTSPVVLGERDDAPLLGAVTLGLMVNPLTRKVRPMGRPPMYRALGAASASRP